MPIVRRSSNAVRRKSWQFRSPTASQISRLITMTTDRPPGFHPPPHLQNLDFQTRVPMRRLASSNCRLTGPFSRSLWSASISASARSRNFAILKDRRRDLSPWVESGPMRNRGITAFLRPVDQREREPPSRARLQSRFALFPATPAPPQCFLRP